MARVCEKWYPLGSYIRQKYEGFYLDDNLKYQLDVLIKNIRKDWDFTIIVSARGRVRIGKSVMAQQIGAYITYKVKELYGENSVWNIKHNIVFDGDKLIEKGHYLGKNHKYSVLIYDEAGADLLTTKVLTSKTKLVIDYFRECGQYNLFNILVLPDFFDLPVGLAVGRSKLLIDVYHSIDKQDYFNRGYYRVYSEKRKKRLYLVGRKYREYNVVKCNFDGRFQNVYTLPEKDYREAKTNALLARKDTGKVNVWEDKARKIVKYQYDEIYKPESKTDAEARDKIMAWLKERDVIISDGWILKIVYDNTFNP